MDTPIVRALLDYIDASPSPFHAAAASRALLDAAGAVRLDERDEWKLEPGRAYYVVRDGAAVAAFRPGSAPAAASGFAIAGAHLDSPCLRLRLEKKVASRGMERAAVEVYGGPIVSSWLDRPLSLAGRAVVRGSSGRPEARLVRLDGPVAVVPNLAIHFNRDMNKGVEYPANTALLPLVAAAGPAAGPASPSADPAAAAGPWALRAVAAALGAEPDAVLSAELSFADAAPAVAFGPDAELLNAPRIDNLEGCHAVLSAFLESAPAAHGQVAVLFDHEEIGSATPRGADSSFLRSLLARVLAASGAAAPQDPDRALARSFCVSVDGAQAWHPAYADKFDEDYAPVINGGPAVKSNANFRYATDALGEAAFFACCAEAGVPCQRFRMRADLPPGSTIGPSNAAHTGVRTVDVGVPMLAMHSIRETSGARDHAWMAAALSRFLARGPALLD